MLGKHHVSSLRHKVGTCLSASRSRYAWNRMALFILHGVHAVMIVFLLIHSAKYLRKNAAYNIAKQERERSLANEVCSLPHPRTFCTEAAHRSCMHEKSKTS